MYIASDVSDVYAWTALIGGVVLCVLVMIVVLCTLDALGAGAGVVSAWVSASAGFLAGDLAAFFAGMLEDVLKRYTTKCSESVMNK